MTRGKNLCLSVEYHNWVHMIFHVILVISQVCLFVLIFASLSDLYWVIDSVGCGRGLIKVFVSCLYLGKESLSGNVASNDQAIFKSYFLYNVQLTYLP